MTALRPILLILTALLTQLLCASALSLRRSATNSPSVLLQFGSAQTTHSFLVDASPNAPITLSFRTSTETIVSWYDLSVTRLSSTQHNVSLTLAFERLPGRARYNLNASETGMAPVTARVAMDVLGVAFFDDDASGPVVRSGDVSELLIPAPRAVGGIGRSLKIATYGGSLLSNSAVLNGITLTPRTIGSVGTPQLLPVGSVRREGEILVVETNPGISGRGVVDVEVDMLQLHGESFETALFVRVA